LTGLGEDRMLRGKKTVAALVVLIFLVGMSNAVVPARAGSTVIHVYEGQSIQAAVNMAIDGSLIIVHAGTYPESVSIDKRLTLLSLGARIDAPESESEGIKIGAFGVKVSGFAIHAWSGILVNGVSDCLISNNEIYSQFYGVVLDGNPSNISILNNKVHTSEHAIYVIAGSNIVMRNNIVYANQMGITMWGPEARIFDNVIYAGCYGVNVMDCDGANIRNNQIQASQIGIHLMGSRGAISRNSVSGDFWSGIAIEADSKSNIVFFNQITGGNYPGDVGIGLGLETSGNLVALNKMSNVDAKIVDEGVGNVIIAN